MLELSFHELIQIFYFSSSDGDVSHFKNNYTVLNLLHHNNNFCLKAVWTFFATGHGKGPCDGIGAAVKSTATLAVVGYPHIEAMLYTHIMQILRSQNESNREVSNNCYRFLEPIYVSNIV